ncbi:uncharacterized protein LOC130736943 [Lotus japonicus]|uniref:uncharacterized protein LOC130736943 n=1 Tax=Lotus japonicus TaxID=34305 RepID=UPI00258EEDC9|nr:uncharacterized protein LOC130736943 [Lotus japonicus]
MVISHSILCGLTDAGYSSYRFTWSNKRSIPASIEERLDYALINESWRALWPCVEVSHLPRLSSDHNPILVSCGHRRTEVSRSGSRMFRFEEVWLQDGDECAEIVAAIWSGEHGDITGKIANIGEALQAWGREKYGAIPKKVSAMKTRLQNLHNSVQTEVVVAEMRSTEAELDNLLKQEEILWSQRSRATWLRHGDRNTKFFHQKATQRRKRNKIEELVDDDGRKWTDINNIARVLTDYFSQLFSTSNPTEIEGATSLVANRITEGHLAVLNSPFTREEVEEAIFHMHPTKAPGLDGLPALFFQKFWHILGDDVSNFCLEVLHNIISPGSINKTLIVLIPKIKKSVHATQFRPISLCNVIFKIITKTIANRLKIVLSDIIVGPQSAFVPGRLITDNALVAYECFHLMKKKMYGRNGMMALKLDMSKAYDRVEWPFLQSVLHQMGFPSAWVSLIMACVTTVQFQVMLNGNPQVPFDPGRGLRQGDPLSPYLFILCGDVFSALIQKEIVASSLHGIKIARSPSAPMISHLLFADDSVVFARATMEEAHTIRNVLASYEQVSGQVINFDKSMLSCSRNVPSPRFNELKMLLGVKAVDSYDKYLGLPTIIDIERMISRFYWSGDASRRGIHWLKWNSLCRSKLDGGIGFRDFKAFNTALVAKTWWRIQMQPESLLGQVFKAVYFPRTTLSAAKKHARPSYAWTSISRTAWVFMEGARWNVGDGKEIDIWRDNWLPSGNPLIYRNDLAQTGNLTHVCHLMVHDMQVWDRDLIELVFWPPTAKEILDIPLPWKPSPDALFWPWTIDGVYTTKTGYTFIRQRRLHDEASTSSNRGQNQQASFWKAVWKAHALPRVKDVVWRAVVGILPVRHALRKRGIEIEDVCPFCQDSAETSARVLFQCPIVARWWYAAPLSVRFQPAEEPAEFVKQIMATKDDEVIAMGFTLIYVIWEHRNKSVHDYVQPSLDAVLQRLAALLCYDDAAVLPHMATSTADQQPMVWRRPVGQFIKLNFDASWTLATGAGMGMVARNSHGEVMAAATNGPVGALSSLVAEAMAFRWCISLARDLGFFRVVLETDCLQLFEAWQQNKRGASYLFSVLNDCRAMVSFFISFHLSFVRRSGNAVADSLAKSSSKFSNVVWIEEVPPELDLLVSSDVLASMAL